MRRLLAVGAAIVLLAIALPGAVRSAEGAASNTLHHGTEIRSYDDGEDSMGQPVTATSEVGVDRSAPVVVLFSLLLAVAVFGLVVAAAPGRTAKVKRDR